MVAPPDVLVIACALVSGLLLAQVPAHATTLNPTTHQELPTFVQHGDAVHAFAYGASTLYHARSDDGGRTWSLREQPLGAFTTVATGLEYAYFVHTVARPGYLLALGYDSALGPQVVRSTDDGSAWGAPRPLASSVVPSITGMHPALHADGDTIVAAWTNHRATGRVFCNRSTDGGATWQANDTLLDVGFVPFSPPVERLLVHGEGPVVHVLWFDGQLRRQRSLDGGATWLPTVGALTAPGVIGYPVKLTGNGTELLAHVGAELARSTDAGDSWTRVANHGVQQVLDVAMAGSLVVAVGRDTATFNPTYFVNTSTDAGATWRPSPLQLPTAIAAAFFPHAYVAHDAVWVHWEVVGFAGNVIRSDDAGATWHALNGPVQSRFSPGAVRTIHTARVAAGIGYRYHAYVGVGSTLLGDATAGSGGVAPRLSAVGLPVRGRTTTLQVDDAVGGSAGMIGISFAPPTAIPLGSAIVRLATLDVGLTFATGGAPGLPGSGAFGLPIAIPSGPSLIGVTFATQALVLDQGVGDGFAVSNALEVWLR